MKEINNCLDKVNSVLFDLVYENEEYLNHGASKEQLDAINNLMIAFSKTRRAFKE